MKIKQHVLSSKKDACKKQRRLSGHIEKKMGNYIEKARVVLGTIDKVLFDGASKKDAKKDFLSGFEDIPYSSQRQKRIVMLESSQKK